MHKNRFHDKWGWLLLAMLICSAPIFAQCPATKSVTYAMVEQGLPNREKLQPTDFLLNLADTSLYAELTLDKDRFLCIDVGIQEVLLSGVTIQGESFVCEEYVWVYDSVFLCSSTINTPRAIAGKITTEANAAVPNVAVGLSSGSANYFQGTSDLGTFFFEDFAVQDYQLTPTNPFDENVRNGITTFDVLLLQKHILGIRLLDSPYKILAADLNSSGDITAYDMLILRQMILSIIDEFPNTPSWRFVDASYEFENPQFPFAENPPSSIDLNMEVLGPQLDIRFVAIKMGDFNNSVDVNTNAIGRKSRTKSHPLFSMENQLVEKGATVKIPFMTHQKMHLEGGQLAINYDKNKLELIDIEAVKSNEKPNFQTNNGVLAISWTNPEGIYLEKQNTLFNFVFRAKESDELINIFQLTDNYLSPEIYTPFGITPFSIDWKETTNVTDFKAFNNYPNPFSTHTTIPFLLPKSGLVTLQIFAANGQKISTINNYFVAGQQQFEITQPLPNSGIYFYRLESESGVATGRMNYLVR